ncbi:MAG: rRNA maturation RNase YbeY [Bacteroidales bacterium]|jgi:rRNA maturation RNase YbeY|nr:rRNA maturation RNase YbeY [Bacteroidales bacterium]
MEPLIQFFSEEVDFSLDDESLIRDWILNVLRSEALDAGVINLIFCNDVYLLDLNQRFLERDTLTDVIAFDYGEEGNEVSGDIFISIDRVRENALSYGLPTHLEVHRVIIHGILHLCGYRDSVAVEKAEMRSKEDKYLSLLTS